MLKRSNSCQPLTFVLGFRASEVQFITIAGMLTLKTNNCLFTKGWTTSWSWSKAMTISCSTLSSLTVVLPTLLFTIEWQLYPFLLTSVPSKCFSCKISLHYTDCRCLTGLETWCTSRRGSMCLQTTISDASRQCSRMERRSWGLNLTPTTNFVQLILRSSLWLEQAISLSLLQSKCF